MSRKYLGIGILVILLIIAGFLRTSRSQIETQKWCIRNSCFTLEIADAPTERTQGLMYRDSLAKNHGMVFIFPQEAKHAFRMKNTIIPLDMIWVDANYSIVDIKEATPCVQDPCKMYTTKTSASYVIELNQGTAKNMGIQSGDVFRVK